MGYDYSCHPVDVSMIRDRIVPYIMGHGKIDDLVDQAVGNMMTRYRSNSWGLALCAVEQRLMEKLQDPEHASLPGFESDLHVWGRPFLNLADDLESSLEVMDVYLKLAGQPLENVDKVALTLISGLNRFQQQLDMELDDGVWEKLNACYPLEYQLIRDDEGFDYNQAEVQEMLENPLNILREVCQNLGKGRIQITLHGVESEVIPEEAVSQVFFETISFASQVIPGWMGRGNYWPTRLFEQIEVNVTHIFERPTDLFKPLINEVPYLEAYLENTITENYSIGGYVPPDKMKLFIKTLEKYKSDLIYAWEERSTEEKFRVDIPLKKMSPFLKIYEPAVYAERHGYGFIEASEIYSGSAGAIN